VSNPNTRASNAFIDYYNAQGIIPVRQDLSDTENFIFRRNYLYKTLGVSLRQLKGRSIIEFGPGGGYNAIATSHYNPEHYVFVDATKASLTELNKNGKKRSLAQTTLKLSSRIFSITATHAPTTLSFVRVFCLPRMSPNAC